MVGSPRAARARRILNRLEDVVTDASKELRPADAEDGSDRTDIIASSKRVCDDLINRARQLTLTAESYQRMTYELRSELTKSERMRTHHAEETRRDASKPYREDTARLEWSVKQSFCKRWGLPEWILDKDLMAVAQEAADASTQATPTQRGVAVKYRPEDEETFQHIQDIMGTPQDENGWEPDELLRRMIQGARREKELERKLTDAEANKDLSSLNMSVLENKNAVLQKRVQAMEEWNQRTRQMVEEHMRTKNKLGTTRASFTPLILQTCHAHRFTVEALKPITNSLDIPELTAMVEKESDGQGDWCARVSDGTRRTTVFRRLDDEFVFVEDKGLMTVFLRGFSFQQTGPQVLATLEGGKIQIPWHDYSGTVWDRYLWKFYSDQVVDVQIAAMA